MLVLFCNIVVADQPVKKFFNDIANRLSRDPDKITGRYGLTLLQNAIQGGDLFKLDALIARGANVNWRGNHTLPPLHFACASYRAEMAAHLIKAGADVNLPDADGLTPLHHAVQRGSLSMVLLLIKSGADVNAPDSQGSAPLHFAQSRGGGIVDALVAAGANVNLQNINGHTPAHIHLLETSLINTLLYHGANVNLKANDGQTPFSLLLQGDLVARHKGLIQDLISYGADINTVGITGETLLHTAIRLGAQAPFDMIINTADTRVCDSEGNTALHTLMSYPNAGMAARLLARDAELCHLSNDRGQQPLDVLLSQLMSGQANMEKQALLMVLAPQLVRAGADVNRAAVDGNTLLHEAVKRRMPALVELLATANANLNARDAQGRAALHLAVAANDISLVDQLLDHGADPDLVDAKGWTLLDRLAEKKDRESPIVQRLIVAGGQYAKQLPLYPDLMRPKTGNVAESSKKETAPAKPRFTCADNDDLPPRANLRKPSGGNKPS